MRIAHLAEDEHPERTLCGQGWQNWQAPMPSDEEIRLDELPYGMRVEVRKADEARRLKPGESVRQVSGVFQDRVPRRVQAMRLIGYCRVSTSEQDCAGQEALIRETASRRAFELLDVATDQGVSAKSLDRPALQNALKRISGQEADGLIVAKLDRLTRSVIDFASLLEWFGQANAVLIALDLDIDTSTPGGKLVANVFAAVAEWEREIIRQRTRDGLAVIRASGRPIGTPAVFDRPEVAEYIKGLRAGGETLQAICDVLNEDMVPTARGASEWRVSAVQTILGYRRPERSRQVCLPEL